MFYKEERKEDLVELQKRFPNYDIEKLQK